MRMYDYIKDSEKVLRNRPINTKQTVEKPISSAAIPNVSSVSVDYNSLNKNSLVKLLWERGIQHNKRQLKPQLVSLLEQDDRKNT